MFCKKLSNTEEEYIENDCELLASVKYLERLRCCVGGSTSEIITDNQVLKQFLANSSLAKVRPNGRKALENFGISQPPGRLKRFMYFVTLFWGWFLEELLLTIWSYPTLSHLRLWKDMKKTSYWDQLSSLVWWRLTRNERWRVKWEMSILMFRMRYEQSLQSGKAYVPWKCVSTIQELMVILGWLRPCIGWAFTIGNIKLGCEEVRWWLLEVSEVQRM